MKPDLIKCMALLAMALPFTASAVTAPLGTASAQLTNFRYHLIDLDPDDGIAPSIQFAMGNQVALFASQGESNSQSYLSSSSPFDTEAGPYSVQRGSDQAIVDGNNLSASSDIHIADAVPSSNASIFSGQHQATLGSRGSSLVSPYSQGWTLSARTALVVEGHALATVNNDLASLLPLTDKVIDSSSSASISMRLNAERDPTLDTAFSKSVFQSSYLDASGTIWTHASDPATLDEALFLTISNEGSTSMKGRLSFGLSAVTSVSMQTLTSSVPEPSQWALYLMGVTLLPLAVGQRRKKQQAMR